MTQAAPKPAAIILQQREPTRTATPSVRPAARPALENPASSRAVDTGPREGVPEYRERLLPMVFGRLSFAYYRASLRYQRHRHIVGRSNTLPVPLLIDSLSIYLCRKLPAWAVARLGPSGVRRAAEIVERTIHAGASTARAVASPFVGAARWVSSVSRRRRQRRAMLATHFLDRAPIQGPGLLFASCFVLEGHEVSPGALRLYWRSVRRFPETCQVFVHLFPEDPSVLTEDRRIHGHFCKDHAPVMDVAAWPRHRTYRDEVSLAGLPPGFYRLVVGIVQVRGVRRLPVDATGESSADLGWIRI
jgi:hypothetical protein